jgi:hypothetical protein
MDSTPTNDELNAIHEFLACITGEIQHSRKGRVWDVWIDGRPIHVSVVNSPARIELSAGCKAIEDYTALRKVAQGLAVLLGGKASEPEK